MEDAMKKKVVMKAPAESEAIYMCASTAQASRFGKGGKVDKRELMRVWPADGRPAAPQSLKEAIKWSFEAEALAPLCLVAAKKGKAQKSAWTGLHLHRTGKGRDWVEISKAAASFSVDPGTPDCQEDEHQWDGPHQDGGQLIQVCRVCCKTRVSADITPQEQPIN
jgi:hypothetical protein